MSANKEMRTGYQSIFFGLLSLHGGVDRPRKRPRMEHERFEFRVKAFASPASYMLLITDTTTGLTYYWAFDDDEHPAVLLRLMETKKAEHPLLVVDVRYNPATGELQVDRVSTWSANTCESVYLDSPYDLFEPEEYTLVGAQDVVHNVNAHLRATCPQYSVQVGDLANLTGTVSAYAPTSNYLTVCLYHDSDCVASIQVMVRGNVAAILSKTHEDFESRGLNTFLRAVVILLGPHIYAGGKPVHFIESLAQNWKSAYVLLSRYECETDAEFRKYWRQLKAKDGGVSFTADVIRAYFMRNEDEDGYMEIKIPLTPANLAKARSEVERVRIKCGDVSAAATVA